MALSCNKRNLALLRGATSKHHGDFYSLNCLHSFSTKNKLELHKKVFGNKIFCNVIMPYKDTKILEFNQNQNPSGFSMTAISSFKSIENKHDVCRGKDCMKIFCESLREHAIKKINFKKKKMKLLTKEQQESYENAKICYICKEKSEKKYLKK